MAVHVFQDRTQRSLPQLEAELGRLRLKVAQQRRVVTELRSCIDAVGFQGVSWPCRLATVAGFCGGLSVALGASQLLTSLFG